MWVRSIMRSIRVITLPYWYDIKPPVPEGADGFIIFGTSGELPVINFCG